MGNEKKYETEKQEEGNISEETVVIPVNNQVFFVLFYFIFLL